MKYVVDSRDGLRVIELPDDARPMTEDDQKVLDEKEAQRLAREQVRQAAIEKAEAKAAKVRRINELKRNLHLTDYQAIKFAEGEMSAEEFAPIKEQRRLWRAEINQLEIEKETD